MEGKDFEYWSQEMWELVVGKYRHEEVRREIVEVGDTGEKMVELHPQKVNLVLLSNRIISQLKTKKREGLPL